MRGSWLLAGSVEHETLDPGWGVAPGWCRDYLKKNWGVKDRFLEILAELLLSEELIKGILYRVSCEKLTT